MIKYPAPSAMSTDITTRPVRDENDCTGRVRHFRALSKTQAGFTLIELLITVAIFGIIGAVAVGSYTKYVQSSRRADAQLALLQIANAEEKFFSNAGRYTASLASIGYTSTSPDDFYVMQVSTTASGYIVKATATGYQARDKSCAEISLDSGGNQKAKDSGNADSTDKCWK
ncbi:MAG: type IV minor pilin protein PilE [marine bacterium B5-7]|nr:MAG: type IV minor pilin protein PilE [marine bacterium B5-7]